MRACDCHPDFHELGVHRPDFSPPSSPDDRPLMEPAA